jgi:hypothetical protein
MRLWMAGPEPHLFFEGLSSNSAVICLISVSLFVLLGLDRSISEILLDGSSAKLF